MAGDSEVGGGNSVHWRVEADKVRRSDTHDQHPGDPNGGKHHQDGIDQDGVVNVDTFTVSIKAPAGGKAAFINLLNEDGDRIWFNLPIANEEGQIRVSWGNSNPNHRGRRVGV